MATHINSKDLGYRVIHPLQDAPEQKLSPDGLGRMHMSRSVRFSLMVLRAYLVVMSALLLYHLLDLAGFLARHVR